MRSMVEGARLILSACGGPFHHAAARRDPLPVPGMRLPIR